MDSTGGDLGHAAKEIEIAAEEKQQSMVEDDVALKSVEHSSEEKRASKALSSSSSSDGATPVAKLDSPIIKLNDVKEGDEAYAHLPDHEREIIKRQLATTPVSVSYRTLYRYATRNDLLLIPLSAFCAIAAGAVMPLMTVCLAPQDMVCIVPLTVVDHLWKSRRHFSKLLQWDFRL